VEFIEILIGVDPGAKGCFVALSAADFSYIDHLQMPLDVSSRVDGFAVAAWLLELSARYCVTGAYIEKVGARPRQGVCSAFSFGYSTGVIVGVLSELRVICDQITPQAWKKAAGLIGTEKDASRIKALESYPQIKDLQKKGKGQALADAIYICRAGAEIKLKNQGV